MGPMDRQRRSGPRGLDTTASLPIEDAADGTAGVFSHWRARVRPRVLSPSTGESLPLDDTIGPILQGGDFGLIRVVGGPGSGKTTAVNHLAGLVPPHLKVSFLDEPDPSEIKEASSRGWVVYTSKNMLKNEFSPSVSAAILQLAPWSEDERIEYLLASDRRLCASVMARLALAKSEAARLEGIPELWRLVLDRMMADPSVQGPRSVLRNELTALLHDTEFRQEVEAACLHAVCIRDGEPRRRIAALLGRSAPEEQCLLRLIRHRPVQLLLAADWVAAAIKSGAENEALADIRPRELVLEAAVRIADDPEVVQRLRSLITGCDRRLHPMVASLLHALRIGWKAGLPSPHLAGAYLDEASWANIDLTGADMRDADLAGANLSGSRLDRANLAGANLAGSNLCDCNMVEAILETGDLRRASLSRARAERACFVSAHLVAANLISAVLDRATFVGADLTDAQLADASLVKADLRSSKLEGSDLSRADLSGATLSGLKLVGAKFAGARFTGAYLTCCKMEGMHLPDTDFADADLSHAPATGSFMRGTNFRARDSACRRPGGGRLGRSRPSWRRLARGRVPPRIVA